MSRVTVIEPGQYRDSGGAFLLQMCAERVVSRCGVGGFKIPLSPLRLSGSQYSIGFPIIFFSKRYNTGTTLIWDR